MTHRVGMLFAALVLLLRAAQAAAAACGTIITIGGVPLVSGDSGTNVPALAAHLNLPLDTAVDAAGDVFFADDANNVVREIVKATGMMLIVAGNGTAGESGDNGPATAAELDMPFGVALDNAGDLFITDFGGCAVREVVQASGDIITVAGDGTAGYSGDGGPATAAELNDPEMAVVDNAGNLYISDQYNYVIREVAAATGTISTIVGNGTDGYAGDNGPALDAELDRPVGLALDAAGDLYIADYGNDVVRRVDKAGGIITTVAGTGTPGYSGDNGPAVSARLDWPQDIAVDFQGNLYIADYNNQVIREVLKASGTILSMAGIPLSAGYSGNNGPATSARLDEPFGVCVDTVGNVYIGDQGNEVIREVTCADGPPSPTISPTFTVSPTITPTPSITPTFTITQTFTITPTFTATPIPLLLTPHYPNPDPAGAEGVWLPYTLSAPAGVDITVYDVAGEVVRTWTVADQGPGTFERAWDLRNSFGLPVASGVYLARIRARSPDGGQQQAWEKCAVAR